VDPAFARQADDVSAPAADALVRPRREVKMNEHGPPVVATRGLTKRFGERLAVDSVDLEVPRGCAFGFLGPNGAGKTTMIRMLLGLTSASEGSMRLLGLPVPERRAEALARVGAIVEQPGFHPHLTGRDNLRVIAAARGPEARGRIESSLRRVGLADRADDRVKEYSLGMRQRLGVARCLLADPVLLILDEPTNGLDPGGILEFRLMIRELVEEEDRSVFLSSHLLDEVEKTCDYAAIVDGGRVVTQGSVAELASEGGRNEVTVGCDDPELALQLLDGFGAVRDARLSDDGLRVMLADGRADAAQLNSLLVGAGLAVHRLEPARHTLEERFLEITTRVGVEA
jgi:ABC-2 type transport system ATP-binding protein